MSRMGTTAEPSISSLLAQIDSLGGNASSGKALDPTEKKQLRLAALKLHRALEEPGDIVERVCFQYLETASIRIAIDLNLFNILVICDKPLTCDALAKLTKADPVLLGRILRSLESTGAIGVVGDIGNEAYVPTSTTSTFIIPPLAAGVEFCFDCLSPNWHELPSHLAKNNYQNPTDAMNAAIQGAWNTKDHFIQFLSSKPAFQRSFQMYMSGFDEGRGSWMDFYPVEKELATGAKQDKDSVMFVDVGGGLGHEAAAVKRRFPDLPGRFVVQELPHVISEIRLDGIEAMAHDFFTSQTLKGARAYYLRYILHDWNDERSHEILTHLREAMDPAYSKILINQWVIPTRHATPLMVHQDLNMMATFAAMERTEQETRDLLDKAGLKISKIYYPADEASECIVEAVAK